MDYSSVLNRDLSKFFNSTNLVIVNSVDAVNMQALQIVLCSTRQSLWIFPKKYFGTWTFTLWRFIVLQKISLQIKCRLLFMLISALFLLNATSAAEVDHICTFNSWADAIAWFSKCNNWSETVTPSVSFLQCYRFPHNLWSIFGQPCSCHWYSTYSVCAEEYSGVRNIWNTQNSKNLTLTNWIVW